MKKMKILVDYKAILLRAISDVNIDCWLNSGRYYATSAKISYISCSFLILYWLDIFQLFTFTTIHFRDCQMIRSFLCQPTYIPWRWRLGWKMQEKKNCPELIRIFAQKIRIKDRFFKFLATRTNEMFGIPWNINGFSGSQGLQRKLCSFLFIHESIFHFTGLFKACLVQ